MVNGLLIIKWYKNIMTENGASLDISEGKEVRVRLKDSGIGIYNPFFLEF